MAFFGQREPFRVSTPEEIAAATERARAIITGQVLGFLDTYTDLAALDHALNGDGRPGLDSSQTIARAMHWSAVAYLDDNPAWPEIIARFRSEMRDYPESRAGEAGRDEGRPRLVRLSLRTAHSRASPWRPYPQRKGALAINPLSRSRETAPPLCRSPGSRHRSLRALAAAPRGTSFASGRRPAFGESSTLPCWPLPTIRQSGRAPCSHTYSAS